MRVKMLILNLIFILLVFLNCEEKTLVEPQNISNGKELSKSTVNEVETVTPILSLPAGNSPEGISVDKKGRIFISNQSDGGSTNQILRVKKNGTVNIYSTLPGIGTAAGMEHDYLENLYVAFRSTDQNTRGVYKIGHNKKPVRLQGSENMVGPNALVFDLKGNLYCTDSDEGSIWKYGKDKYFTKWFEHPLLAGGIPSSGPPFPLPGANGIVFYPPNKLYVANTMQNSICRVTIDQFGNPLGIDLVKQDLLLLNVDGIAIDINENIYGVLVASTLQAIGAPPVPPVIKLNVKTGDLSPFVSDNSHFDTPTSIAFGKGCSNFMRLFITNAALQYGQPPMAGPGVVLVYSGTIGF